MTRLNVVLVLAIVASALVLIRTAHESRRLRRVQATNLRVEKVARERLAMRAATPALTFYVTDPAAAESTASAPEAAR